MSDQLVKMDEIARRAAREKAERESRPDPWGMVAEIVLAFVLACILDLFCC